MSWRTRHRGPYLFLVVRPGAKRPASAWLRGHVEADEIEHDARALLDDPRDTISAVHVWSEREQQFVMTYKRSAA